MSDDPSRPSGVYACEIALRSVRRIGQRLLRGEVASPAITRKVVSEDLVAWYEEHSSAEASVSFTALILGTPALEVCALWANSARPWELLPPFWSKVRYAGREMGTAEHRELFSMAFGSLWGPLFQTMVSRAPASPEPGLFILGVLPAGDEPQPSATFDFRSGCKLVAMGGIMAEHISLHESGACATQLTYSMRFRCEAGLERLGHVVQRSVELFPERMPVIQRWIALSSRAHGVPRPCVAILKSGEDGNVYSIAADTNGDGVLDRIVRLDACHVHTGPRTSTATRPQGRPAPILSMQGRTGTTPNTVMGRGKSTSTGTPTAKGPTTSAPLGMSALGVLDVPVKATKAGKMRTSSRAMNLVDRLAWQLHI